MHLLGLADGLSSENIRKIYEDSDGTLWIGTIGEGAYTLHFARGGGREFSVLLGFPASRGVHYPISSFPRLNELRTMLAALRRLLKFVPCDTVTPRRRLADEAVARGGYVFA